MGCRTAIIRPINFEGSPEKKQMRSNLLRRIAGSVIRNRDARPSHMDYLVYSWGDQAKSEEVASGTNPLLSTLLLLAVQKGKLSSVDAPVTEAEPANAKSDR